MEVEDWEGYSRNCYRDKILNSVSIYEAREDILGILNGKLVHHFHRDFDALQIILISLKNMFFMHLLLIFYAIWPRNVLISNMRVYRFWQKIY